MNVKTNLDNRHFVPLNQMFLAFKPTWINDIFVPRRRFLLPQSSGQCRRKCRRQRCVVVVLEAARTAIRKRNLKTVNVTRKTKRISFRKMICDIGETKAITLNEMRA